MRTRWQNLWTKHFPAQQHPVASLAVQARQHEHRHTERSPFRVLTAHLLAGMFAPDLPEADAPAVRRALQIAAAAMLPPILLTFGLMGYYNGLMPFGKLRTYPLQAEDHFVYLSYAFAVSGAAALLKWEAFFPTLLDVRVLGSLPLSPRRLFAAKVLASTLFLALFVLGANLPSAFLLPAMATPPSLLRQVLAHLLAILAAGACAVSLPLSLLLLIEALFTGFAKRTSQLIVQGAAIAYLVVIAVISPWTAVLAQTAEHRIPAVLLLPPLWFTGLYEVLQGANPQAVSYRPLAHLGLLVTIGSLALLLALYPVVYRRRVRLLWEGDGMAMHRQVVRHKVWERWLDLALPTPKQKATFFFINATVCRVQRIRITLIIACSLGVGTALAIHIATEPKAALQWSPVQVLFSAGVLMLFFAVGVLFAFNTAQEPRASWVFENTLVTPPPAILQGLRRWHLTYSAGLGAIALVAGRLLTTGHPSSPALVFREMLCLGAWAFLLTELFFCTFRDIPFASSRLQQRVHTAFLLVCVLACPLLILVFAWFSRAYSITWFAPLGLVLLAALTHWAAKKWFAQLDLQRWANDGDEVVQRLLSQN